MISTLRQEKTSLKDFREAADRLATLLAAESGKELPRKKIEIKTPLESTEGEVLLHEPLLVPILRSGLTLLPAFLQFYPKAPVGFVGMKRDEATAIPKLYYKHLPTLTKETPVFLLDPMIATGGSASLAIEELKKEGALEKNISLIACVASPEGVQYLEKTYPELSLHIAELDQGLNKSKFIVPGLGDYGDRYFGEVD